MRHTATGLLVTGGAGFIGRNLVETLCREGYSVRVLDDVSLGNREWVHPLAEVIEGDICAPATCRTACRGVQVVFHLAALSRVAPTLDDPVAPCRSNIVGTLNVLEACRLEGVEQMIYSGSSTAYGSLPPPHQEDIPASCLNSYALSKYVGEEYCRLYSQLYGLPTVVLRYFQVYGPRQPTTGAYAMVVGSFLEQSRNGRSLTIHGSGEQFRDFVHVSDVVQANVLAFRERLVGVTINVGTGKTHSVKQLASLISSQHEHTPTRRQGDSDGTPADISRCRELLGWVPTIDLADWVRGQL